MNKGKTAFIISIQFLFILFVVIACQNTAPNTDSIEVENSVSTVSSSTVTPKPKETTTPTVNPATQTAIVWDATSDAFFLTSKANTMIRKTAVIKTFSAKEILCQPGYKINPRYDFPLVIDFYKTDKDSWTVLGCYNEDNSSKAYLEIINQDNSKHYTISQEGLNIAPMRYLTVLHLDSKNNFLYFDTHRINSGSGFNPYTYFRSGSDIYQLNLENGYFEIVLQRLTDTYYQQTVFSPDLRQIVFSTSDEPNKISFLDTSTKKIVHTITLGSDFTYTGAFLWSEDNNQMIFAAGHQGWDEEKNGIAIFKVDINTWSIQEILDSDTLRLVPWYPEYGENIWIDENTISLVDIFTQDLYKLDIVTGELSELKE